MTLEIFIQTKWQWEITLHKIFIQAKWQWEIIYKQNDNEKLYTSKMTMRNYIQANIKTNDIWNLYKMKYLYKLNETKHLGYKHLEPTLLGVANYTW